MSSPSSLEGIQVVGTRKYRLRKTVPEFTSRKKERMSILVNSCIRGLEESEDMTGKMRWHVVGGEVK